MSSNLYIIWKGATENIPNNLIDISESWDSILNTNSGTIQKPDSQRSSIDLDLAALIYTSGSTGEPKGVMSTHRNMVSAARSIIQYLENTENDIILNVLPLSFDYGLYQVLMSFIFGGTVVLEKSFLYVHSILAKIAQENVTGFPIVPTILVMILNLQDLTKSRKNVKIDEELFFSICEKNNLSSSERLLARMVITLGVEIED